MASKGVKIVLIGCGVLGVVFIIVVAAGGYFVKDWFSEKTKSISKVAESEKDYDSRTAELREDYSFTPPSNGVITERQLTRFLAVRKAMYEVYKKNEAEFKKMEESKEQGFSILMKATNLIQDVKMTQVKAMEEQKMSPEEYSYIVEAVYKSWFAKGAKETMKHETLTETSQEQMKQSLEELDKKIQDPNTSQQEKEVLMKTKEMMESQWKAITESKELKQMDAELESVPKENIELFAKHQQEIQQYSMSGLEFIGL